MAGSYSVENEYVTDIKSPKVQEKIAKAKAQAADFLSRHANLTLEDPAAIHQAYQEAEREGIFKNAANMRTLLFGNRTTTYGVSYIADDCTSGCTYCPIRYGSKDDAGKPIQRRALNVDDFRLDTQEIIKDGHTHICFLTGDGTLTLKPDNLIPYLKELNAVPELKEIILNVTPQPVEVFKQWRAAAPDKSMQFRVFQETYDLDVYRQKHTSGIKQGYEFRRNSQARAMEAGFDNYGLGALLGLNTHFLQEITAVAEHAAELTQKYKKPPARVCIPTANELAGIKGVEKQKFVSEEAVELAYALAKLAMPETSIVSSERDKPELLEKLDAYATNRTVDVQPSVGGNLAQVTHQDRLLQQSTTHPTPPNEAIAKYRLRGRELVFDY